jgi:hypothetical protein
MAQLPETISAVKKTISVKMVDTTPKDFDVMFSESAGMDVFERTILQRSKHEGRINFKLANSISILNHLVNPNYVPMRTKDTLHGICFRDNRSLKHYYEFNKDLIFLNVGDPDWDILSTNEFKDKVYSIRSNFGQKLLVLGASLDMKEVEAPWWQIVINIAERLNFKVIICPHPGCIKQVAGVFPKYVDSTTDHHVLFASASHVIGEIGSTIIAESLMLGSVVGATPFVPHSGGYSKHAWVNSSNWYDNVHRMAGREILDMVTFIENPNVLEEFLSNLQPIPRKKVDEYFGWPKVENYCSHLFRMVEETIKEGV